MKKKIIEKIRKILALSRSPNRNEAAAAIYKAKKFLRQYELSMADVLEASEDDVRDVIVDVKPSSRIPRWIHWTVEEITRILDVSAYEVTEPIAGKWCRCYHWVGFEADVALAHYAFSLLRRGIQSGMAAKRKEIRSVGCYPPRNFRNSYALGFLAAVEKELEVLARQPGQEEMTVPGGTNLPVLKRSAIERYIKNLKLGKPRGTGHLSVDRLSYRLGAMDGRNFRIRRPVDGADTVRALA